MNAGRYLEEIDGRVLWLRNSVAPLRDHPRFQALLEQYGSDVER